MPGADLAAHRRLVHDDLPGAPRSGGHRPRRRVRRRPGRRAPRSRRSRNSCWRSRTTASATACCATSTPRRRPSSRALPGRRSASTTWAGCGGAVRATPTVGWMPVDGRGPRRRPARRTCPWRRSLDINADHRTPGRRPALRRHVVVPARACSPPTEVGELARPVGRRADRARPSTPRVPARGGLTPSDLDLVDLDQDAIERLERRFPALTDVWPLSPLQSGLLFHAQLADDIGRRLPRAAGARPARRRRPAPAAPGRPGAARPAPEPAGRVRPRRGGRGRAGDPGPGGAAVAGGRPLAHWTEDATAARDRRDCWPRTGPPASTWPHAPLLRFTLVRTADGPLPAGRRPTTTSCSTAGRCRCCMRDLLDALRDGRRPGGRCPASAPTATTSTWLTRARRPPSPRAAWADRARRGRRADPARPADRAGELSTRRGRDAAFDLDRASRPTALRALAARARAHPQHRRAGRVGNRARRA